VKKKKKREREREGQSGKGLGNKIKNKKANNFPPLFSFRFLSFSDIETTHKKTQN
jgi:hypothetical protein